MSTLVSGGGGIGRALLVALALCAAVGARAAPGPKVPITVTITPERPEIVEGEGLRVGFRVCNKEKVAICICTWPGLAVSFAWDEPDGSRSAVGRGYPDTRVLEASYFMPIEPGKCYEEHIIVDDLFSPPTGRVTLLGEFRSDQTGEQYGLHCWRGQVNSERVEVTVRRKGKKDAP